MKKEKNISKLNKKTWEDYIKDPKDIFDKELKDVKQTLPTYRFKFDLHGYSLDEANLKVKELIHSCFDEKYLEILLITGKGIHSKTDNDVFVSKKHSKLKFSIPEFIKSNPDLLNKIKDISAAPISEGGDGALILKLKRL